MKVNLLLLANSGHHETLFVDQGKHLTKHLSPLVCVSVFIFPLNSSFEDLVFFLKLAHSQALQKHGFNKQKFPFLTAFSQFHDYTLAFFLTRML